MKLRDRIKTIEANEFAEQAKEWHKAEGEPLSELMMLTIRAAVFHGWEEAERLLAVGNRALVNVSKKN